MSYMCKASFEKKKKKNLIHKQEAANFLFGCCFSEGQFLSL